MKKYEKIIETPFASSKNRRYLIKRTLVKDGELGFVVFDKKKRVNVSEIKYTLSNGKMSIYGLKTEFEYRHLDLMKTLERLCEQEARRKGINEINVHYAAEKAIPFYKKIGYKKIPNTESAFKRKFENKLLVMPEMKVLPDKIKLVKQIKKRRKNTGLKRNSKRQRF